jgi:nucleotide-binding universal stress UspA family protein
MKVLVLTSEPITAEQLRQALKADLGPGQVEVMVVAPALQERGLKFWLSDADDAIARAEEVWRGAVRNLDSAGVPATGDTGESDPLQAIQDALQTFDADRIVLFTHRDGDRQYREDIDRDEVAERFGVPVEEAALSG